MIKVLRRKTEKALAAQRSLVSAKLHKRKCNTDEVIVALHEMFYGKCYICESVGDKSMDVEHRIPCKGDDDLRYDWNNIFLSCAYCNNIKLAKYDHILDCTVEDVDLLIAFHRDGYLRKDSKISIIALDRRPETVQTVELLNAVYIGTTKAKQFGADNLRRFLYTELNKFDDLLARYHDAVHDDEKKDSEQLLRRELSGNVEGRLIEGIPTVNAFTAFKRWRVRDQRDRYPEAMFILDEVMSAKL